MEVKTYGLICPITKACELLESRWTIPILAEIWSGSSRFNDIRRGVGNISSALLSKRLKEMQANGLIERVDDPATGGVEYVRTEMAVALEPTLNSMAVWAQRFIDADVAVSDTNIAALIWKLRRSVIATELPQRRVVMRFHFSDPNLDFDTCWLLAQPGSEVELCTSVPDFDVDLFVETTVKSISAILMARSTVSREVDEGRLFLSGDARIIKSIGKWLRESDYADIEGIATV
ncbi:winged helix-turn-helix transcriptional regulator [Ovoidimarina sediminis]|uniref:winged helix-turn-helix transcriptional regulator n=1 Tax=Ovoidimarina sediminis TaxID=3079856 RepID=UPI00291432DC|nr:helix-turn-helix domain-containing protein [Rhodophyticola sp. MJ-SS7]MDU8945617.1 helix-turn-helix domain-containing protein [Rhodophyticola sp. MJ-SS7]